MEKHPIDSEWQQLVGADTGDATVFTPALHAFIFHPSLDRVGIIRRAIRRRHGIATVLATIGFLEEAEQQALAPDMVWLVAWVPQAGAARLALQALPQQWAQQHLGPHIAAMLADSPPAEVTERIRQLAAALGMPSAPR
ncbi:hypothetical protein F8S13_08635 [Chloroflexia bacterium SDU3-3]|nr:hypothetical protein F8S13_08635 [Chloroflexia bacterium SDU3-3]